jgi:predicted 3-demethylubiquinone-9 3-methyltransferase (glyoxalase superfamily)
MRAEPCLYFDGRCEEAVKFYRHTVDEASLQTGEVKR